MQWPRIRAPGRSVTMAAAVSSQLVSMPRMFMGRIYIANRRGRLSNWTGRHCNRGLPLHIPAESAKQDFPLRNSVGLYLSDAVVIRHRLVRLGAIEDRDRQGVLHAGLGPQ